MMERVMFHPAVWLWMTFCAVVGVVNAAQEGGGLSFNIALLFVCLLFLAVTRAARKGRWQ